MNHIITSCITTFSLCNFKDKSQIIKTITFEFDWSCRFTIVPKPLLL